LDEVRLKILEWFMENGRHDLPWRKGKLTQFQYLLTEKLLQQTTVTHVLKIYHSFMKKYGEPYALAEASKKELASMLKPLGFYNFRADEFIKIAKEIVEKFEGKVPEDLESLKSLPGIGDYTAKSVLIAACGEKLVAVDENLKRLGGRFFFGVEKASRKQVRELEEKFLEMMGDSDPREFNWALLDFSWAVCKKNPVCEECPIRRYCRYYSTRGSPRS